MQPTAEELNVDFQLVDDAVAFFYSEVRKALVEMRGPAIQVPNLGTFKVKPGELPKLIHKYEKHLTVLQPETFNQMATRKDVELRLKRVQDLMKSIEEEKERKMEFLRTKNESTQNNME